MSLSAEEISDNYDVNYIVAEILKKRGIDNEKELELFFNSSLDDLGNYNDIPNIDKAIEKINTHATLGNILLFSDYDVDGLTSATIMFKAIKKLMPEASINILPSDRNRDGYSLSSKAIDIIDNKYPETTLVITLDCGITSTEEIKELEKRGYEYLIIDHHNPESIEEYNNNFVDLKAKQGNYPVKDLCNAGLTWRIGQKLTNDNFKEVLDLVSIATVADVVPLKAENRVIVKEGLNYIRQARINEGISNLASQMNKSLKNMSSSDIGYAIGPAINACGRLNGVDSVLDLLLYRNRNTDMSLPRLAHKIKKINQNRKKITNNIFDNLINKVNPDRNVIVVGSNKIREGLVGLIAGKIKSRYRKPTIVIDLNSGKGSARSVEPFNMYENLKICEEEGLLNNAGGHNMAAGINIDKDMIEEFDERINELASDVEYKGKRFDIELPIQQIDKELVKDINKLKPFGKENRKPLFKSRIKISDKYIIKGRHVSFKANGVDSIIFNAKHKKDDIKNGRTAEIIYEPQIRKNEIQTIVRYINF